MGAQAPGGPSSQNSPTPLPTRPIIAPSSAGLLPTPQQNPVYLSPAASAATATNADDQLVQLNLPDVDIDTLLSTLEMFTGKIILRPSQLPTAPGGYNLKINKRIPKSQAILYLETILAMNNIAVIPLGKDALKVVQLPQARLEAPPLIEGSTLDLPPSSKIASKLFQLTFLRVQEFQQMLPTMTNSMIGQAVPLANANAILITDTVSNLQRIETVLQEVDRPSMNGMAPKFYQLRNGAKASDVVAKLHAILTGSLQQQIGLGTSFNADDRTNQIILITDPRQFPFFDELIDKMDVTAEPNTRNDVIFLKHAKAADLVQVLVNIIQRQSQATQKSGSTRPTTPLAPNQPVTPGQPPGPISGTSAAAPEGATTEFSSLVTVVNDDRSNSIVVSGTVDDLRLMHELIDKLDNVLPEVRIEVVIADVTLDDNHQSGISQLGLQVQGDKLVGFNLSGGSGYPVNIGGGVDSTSGNSTGFMAITRNNGNIDLAGIIGITTSPRRNNTTVLSVPTVTTSHAKQATFISSLKQPIITGTTSVPIGTTSAAGGFSTSQQVTQQDIGITLTVTPLIGIDGSVQMDIDADVQDQAGKININGVDQPIISHRETKSTVTAHSGDIIVIGGMQRNKDSRTTSRLGPIPIIGDLLGARSKTLERSELIFFLRPTVLSNTAQDNQETISNMKNLPARQVPQKDDILKRLDPNYVPPKKSTLDKILPH